MSNYFQNYFRNISKMFHRNKDAVLQREEMDLKSPQESCYAIVTRTKAYNLQTGFKKQN